MYKQGSWEWLLASIMTCFERPGSSLFAETWQFQNLKPFGHFFLIRRKIEKMAIKLLKSKLFFHLISSKHRLLMLKGTILMRQGFRAAKTCGKLKRIAYSYKLPQYETFFELRIGKYKHFTLNTCLFL